MASAISSDSLPEILSASWPTLRTYCPVLQAVSPPQALFLLLDCTEAFYGGAVGGGKTAALLMAALQYVDVPGYAALIMRRTFPELEQPDGPISQSLRWFAETPEAIRPVYNRADHEWTFPSGAVLKFGHLDNPNAMIRYQGGGYHFFGFDELTHFEERAYEFIGFSRTRRPPHGPLSQVPMRVRGTGNPGGPGHGWVKRRFIDTHTADTAFVPAKLADNPGIDYDDYVKRLDKLNPILRQQLLDGDWGAFEGAAFLVSDDSLIDRFTLKDSYERFEAADYGFNGAPWSLIAVDYEGNLVFTDMLYGFDLLPSELCVEVLAKRKDGWGFDHRAFVDPSVWKRTSTRNRFGAPAMLSDEFQDSGIAITRANNDPRAGLARLREMLKCDPEHLFPAWHPRAGEKGAPRVFFDRVRCDRLVEELRSAPLQPIDSVDGGEKVDSKWESAHGHACAMARYAVMTRPSPSAEPSEPVVEGRSFAMQRELELDRLREQEEALRARARATGSPRTAALLDHEDRVRRMPSPSRFIR